MNLLKQMNDCPICGGSDISKYGYGNHLGRLKLAHVQHGVVSALLPSLRVLHKKYYDWVKANLLFLPFSHISNIGPLGQDNHGLFLRRLYSHESWSVRDLLTVSN